VLTRISKQLAAISALASVYAVVPLALAAPNAGASPEQAARDSYLQQVRQGDAAYLARDFEVAARIFAEAIKAEPRKAIGHYRLGETLRAAQKYDEALEAFGSAARFAHTLELKARAVFSLADTYERAARLPRARDEWTTYLQVAAEHAAALVAKQPGATAEDALFVTAAQERLKQVNAALERNEQFAEVKRRIEQREAELDKQTRADDANKTRAKKVPASDL
jgi:tetratricopeptide (TPR) repeat protein